MNEEYTGPVRVKVEVVDSTDGQSTARGVSDFDATCVKIVGHSIEEMMAHERRAMMDTLLRLNCLYCLEYRTNPMPYLIVYAGPAGTVGTYQRNTLTGVARAFNDACAASFDAHGELQPVAADATARPF